jgi:hypothetical protein
MYPLLKHQSFDDAKFGQNIDINLLTRYKYPHFYASTELMSDFADSLLAAIN